MIMRGSYGRDSITWLYGAIQFYCDNGMVMGEFEQGVRRHSKHVHIADITHNMRHGVKRFHTTADTGRAGGARAKLTHCIGNGGRSGPSSAAISPPENHLHIGHYPLAIPAGIGMYVWV